MTINYVIGLDYGTESARAILVETGSGEILAHAIHKYQDGVIDSVLPHTDVNLEQYSAFQNPADWLRALEIIIPEVIQTAEISPDLVRGIGVDFTSCTVLPIKKDGTPLCFLDHFRNKPQAWPKLWKHHAAQDQADRINELALKLNVDWIKRYGSKISSEWMLPKALEILEKDREAYEALDFILEGGDWITAQLTGNLSRNACGAGYKGIWHKSEGHPDSGFLSKLHLDFTTIYSEKTIPDVIPPGKKVGVLTDDWAEKLGLSKNVSVGAAIIDAHSAAIGAGVSQPGTMFLIMGTSTCHMLLDEKEMLVEGISGVVEDGIVSGLFGYEAGQAGVGDIFGWYVQNAVPDYVQVEAKEKKLGVHDYLTEQAIKQKPGQHGLLALDWWNGCRTPYVDADLTGMILGFNLQTRPQDIYRALIESTAYGTRKIISLFLHKGIQIKKLRAGGGLTKNKMLLQIYADVTGLPIEVMDSVNSSALGAAILGAVAAGEYPNVHEAVMAMAEQPSRTILPDPEAKEIYDRLYKLYERLTEQFSKSHSEMKELLEIQKEQKELNNLE